MFGFLRYVTHRLYIRLMLWWTSCLKALVNKKNDQHIDLVRELFNGVVVVVPQVCEGLVGDAAGNVNSTSYARRT